MAVMTASHGGRSHPSASVPTSSTTSPLLSRPLLSLLLVLAGGAFALCLLEVRTLTAGGASSASQSADVATMSITEHASSVLRLQPMATFRPIRRLADSISDNVSAAAAAADTPTEAHTNAAAAGPAVDAAGLRSDHSWVSPLSNVHEWPPSSPTVSTYRWKSHATPLWQMVVEPKGQTVDFASVAIRNGRLIFYGLTAEQQAELRADFEPFMHFDGVDARLDKVDDVTAFVEAPLDWSTCGAVQASYTFFVTPWMPMLYYHVVCEHLINGYANLRSANALPQKLMSTFQSPALPSSHPRSLFDEPLPPFYSSPATLSPFTSAHLSNDSIPALYVYTRWKQMDASAGIDLLYKLFEGQVSQFNALEIDTLTCFRRIRFGRGVPLHYFARVFPFPLPPSAPVWSNPLDTYTPAAAKRLEKADLNLYTDIELGRWAGIMIDFHNYIMHALGRERRVRDKRDTNTHEPLPNSVVESPASPRVLLVIRGTPQGRFINNRDCLVNAFQKQSLTLTPCCDWKAPLASTIAEFQAADILVGLHGAGFTNLLWMPPGGLVIEIQTHFNPDNNYFHPLSNHMDHAYKVVDGRAFHHGDKGYHFSDEWCAQFAATTVTEWQHKHSSEGRFNNVYGVGNFSVDWMRKDNGGVK